MNGQSSHNLCIVPGVSVAVPEREDFVDHLSREESAARHCVLEGEPDDNDSFVDIMGGITAVGDAESAGLLRMRWHVQICQWRRQQRVLSTHLVCLHVSLLSSLPISF